MKRKKNFAKYIQHDLLKTINGGKITLHPDPLFTLLCNGHNLTKRTSYFVQILQGIGPIYRASRLSQFMVQSILGSVLNNEN